MPQVYSLQTNFNAGELSPLMYGRTDFDKYAGGCSTLKNFVVMPQGGIRRRGGSRYINSGKTGSKQIRLVRFEFSVTQAYIIEFGDLYIRFYKDLGIIEDGGSPVEVVTPYTEAQLSDLRFVQSADTLYIVHPSHPPATLTRTSHIAWTYAEIDWIAPAFADANTDVANEMAVDATTGTGVTLVSTASLFTAASVGQYVKLIENVDERYKLWQESDARSTGDYRYYGNNLYQAASSGTTGTQPPVHLNGTESDGQVDWTYINSGFGVAKITAYTSATQVTVEVIIDIPEGFEDATPTAANGYYKYALGEWNDTDGYPSVITFYEQRLWLAANDNKPQTLWASKTGDYTNFTTGVADDDGLAYTIATDQVNAIQWMSPGTIMLLGTLGAEFKVSASDLEEAITPNNIRIVRESTNGCYDAEAIRLDNTAIYIQRSQHKIRQAMYDFAADSYISPELTLLSEHLAGTGIEQIELQHNPYNIIWARRTDGVLVGMTYLREQEVIAWHQHELGGVSDASNNAPVIESMAILPSPDGEAYDELWLSVKRYVNSATIRSIEVIRHGFKDDADIEDATYLDCHLSYDSTPVSSVSGLDHLEGEDVQVLGDGTVLTDKTVSSGAISLGDNYSVVHAGYTYNSDIATLNIEGEDTPGHLKRVSLINTYLYQSVNLKIGRSFTELDSISFREVGDPMGTATQPFTGYREITFEGTYTNEAKVCMRQDQPLPLTILSLSAKIDVNIR